MAFIFSMVIWFASSVSKRRKGQTPLVGSRPMKKFRVTDISGIIARCWCTVAIPAAIASVSWISPPAPRPVVSSLPKIAPGSR